MKLPFRSLIHNILLLIFQLATIDNFLANQVELKLRADGDSFFNFYVMDVKSDGGTPSRLVKLPNCSLIKVRQS